MASKAKLENKELRGVKETAPAKMVEIKTKAFKNHFTKEKKNIGKKIAVTEETAKNLIEKGAAELVK